MINKNDGYITVPQYNTILAKDMTVAELEQTLFYKSCFKGWFGYHTYPFASFTKISYKNVTIGIAPRFRDGRLCHTDIFTYEDGDPLSWDDWREDKLMNIYQRNNVFLEEELGYKGVVASRPFPLYEYMFEWGTIYSTFDIRSGSSVIGIAYK